MRAILPPINRRFRSRCRCNRCGQSFYANAGPVLRHELWKKISKRFRDRLCDICVRAALGRPFNSYDFLLCAWNLKWAELPKGNPHPTWGGPWLMRHVPR